MTDQPVTRFAQDNPPGAVLTVSMKTDYER